MRGASATIFARRVAPTTGRPGASYAGRTAINLISTSCDVRVYESRFQRGATEVLHTMKVQSDVVRIGFPLIGIHGLFLKDITLTLSVYYVVRTSSLERSMCNTLWSTANSQYSRNRMSTEFTPVGRYIQIVMACVTSVRVAAMELHI